MYLSINMCENIVMTLFPQQIMHLLNYTILALFMQAYILWCTTAQ